MGYKRKPGGWRKLYAPGGVATGPEPVTACGWDQLLERLEVRDRDPLGFGAVRRWVDANFKRRYVPEDILERMGYDASEMDRMVVVMAPKLSGIKLGSMRQGATQRDS